MNATELLPKVSICTLTYNHAPFIRQCLDGILMQQVDFPFEIIIHDDCSTDGTTEIIREYESKYPDIIRPIYQPFNQFSQGIKGISRRIAFPKIRGKYVALCEGDDYWTDPLKLQKQVDSLDAHPDCSICFHQSILKWENDIYPDSLIPQFPEQCILSTQDLLKENFIPTASVMYRWPFDREHNKIEEAVPSSDMLPGDWMIHLLVAEHGNIFFINSPMAVYRRHSGGIWWGGLEDPEFCLRCSVPFLRFYNFIENRFNHNFYEDKRFLLKKTIPPFASLKQEDKLKELQELDPEIYHSVLLEISRNFHEHESLIPQLQSTIQKITADKDLMQADNNEFKKTDTYLRTKLKCYRKRSQLLCLILALFGITILYFILFQ